MWKLIINRVVINVGTVNKGDGLVSINERLVVAGDNLGDGNLMTTVQITLCDAGNVDGRIRCAKAAHSLLSN